MRTPFEDLTLNSLSINSEGQKAFEEKLEKSLATWAAKQRPPYRTRVELLARAEVEKYPYAKLLELRRFSNGVSTNHPSFFSLLHNHQWRLFSIWLNF